MLSALNFVWLVLFVCGARAQNEVSVVLLELEYGQPYTLTVNRSVEYLINFMPTEQQRLWPSRVWAAAGAGDVTRPVLLTARQRTGAATWQLPYYNEERLLYELQRTLCPDDAGGGAPPSADCDGEGEAGGGGGGRRGGWSLHVGSACAASVSVSLRADAVHDFALPFETDTTYFLTQAAPRVAHYRWADGQQRVRLVARADDDACATVSVQNYTCPIAQTMDVIETRGLRMTVEQSGAVQLSRSSYPYGFLVVGVVRGSGVPCRGEPARDQDWLWEAAVWGERDDHLAAPTSKHITFTVKAALSRAQYAVATGATLALFLVFYAAFGALLLARRWPPLARRVGSLAVLADHEVTEGAQQAQSQTDAGGAAGSRRRRGSNATFDSSSDDSDTDSEPEPLARGASPASPGAATPATATTGVGSPAPASPAPASPAPASPAPASPAPASPAPASPAPASPAPATPASASPAPASPAPASPAPSPPPQFRDADAAAAREAAAAEAAETAAAVPAPTIATEGTQETNGTPEVNGHVTSETDVQQRSPGAAGAAGARPLSEAERPFGLPRRLRLDALARRRGRVLRARSDRYLHTLYTVAVFYALPVIQFVAAFQILMNVSGSLDICYYNFLCAHPAGALADFNHVLSNLGYLLLGALLMLQLRARRRRRRRKPRHEDYGIPAHYGMLGALGAGMMVVALLSASYHVCPNRLNFQFDVAFMYVLAVLSMVKIYQARHPDVNARAHATFGVLALLIAIVVWGVLGGGALFWGAATVLHVFAVLLLSLRIYYVGQFRFEKASLAVAARGLRGLPGGARARPLYAARLVLLLIANAVNWGFALYGLFTQAADFASHLLNVLLANTLMYMLFYLTMKLLHGERPRWYAWCYLGGAVLCWTPALYFFLSGSSDWSATPALSRHRNHECKVLEFYDSHDLWHLLSAAALYLSFAAMMTWDDGLSAVRRADIAVF